MSTVVESGPTLPARLLTRATRLTVRPALRLACHAPHLPWPYELVESAAHMVPRPPGVVSSTVQLPKCTGELVHADQRTRGAGRVILYIHGGGFLVCGPHTHTGIITRLSRYAECPVLAVDYRMIPDHTMSHAIQDCVDAYWWLREFYEPGQIVLAADSAGGYLALATALELHAQHEGPAGLALMSPLLQLNPDPKKLDRNISSDAMFCGEVFDTLADIVRLANGGGLYEPLHWLSPGLPPVLIHVSGSEVLLHDAELAANRLGDVGVPVELRVWPGQIHVFQIASWLPEAGRSLGQLGAFVKDSTSKFMVCNRNGLTTRTVAVR